MVGACLGAAGEVSEVCAGQVPINYTCFFRQIII